MWLHDLLKADELIKLYGPESSFFKQPNLFYITFNDVDPDFEFRLMVGKILDPDLECKVCKQKQSAVRVIYRTKTHRKEAKPQLPKYSYTTWTYTTGTNYTNANAESDVISSSYKWAYVCTTECLDRLRAKILMSEVKEASA